MNSTRRTHSHGGLTLNPAPPQAGFTLLELVVVLGIFAVVSIMAYGGLGSVLTLRDNVERSLDRTVALQRAYLRLRNDFQQLRARPARDGYGETQPALVTQLDGRTEFTRGGWRNPLQQPRSSLERVAYRLDEKNRLLRESWRVLDRAQDSVLVETPLLENVEELSWRFLDRNRQWQTRWPPLEFGGSGPAMAQAPPPLAVELTVRSRDWGELTFLFMSGGQPLP
jgi:general secretion pathway protein J